MDYGTSSKRTPLWVLVAKGWFFGMLGIALPLVLVIALSLPFVENGDETKEIIFGLLLLPVILVLQGLMIAVVVSFGIKLASLVGFQERNHDSGSEEA